MMKTTLALAALALAMPLQAAPRTLQDAQADTAYVTGRCSAYMSVDGLVGVKRFFAAQEAGFAARLSKLYYQGVQDSRANPLTEEQCGSMLDAAKAEMQSLSG